MSRKSKIILGDPINEKEFVSQPENGVGFEFGKSVPDLKTQKNLIQYFDRIQHDIVGTQNKVIIRGYASHPGSNSFNRNLSLKRAQWLKAWLVDQGVDSERISVIPMGEWAVEPGIDEPENPDAEYDVAENRSALIDIEYNNVPDPIPKKEEDVKDESELTELRNERFPDNFDQDWLDGKELFQKLVEPEADLIRREIALPENPIMAAPSDNPEKFQGQVWDIVKGGRKINPLQVGKTLGKSILGSFIDLATSNLTGEIADQRYDMYGALSIAVAAGIDENYDADLKSMTDVQRALYNHLLPKVEKLSTREKHVIQAYLVEKDQGSNVSVNPTRLSEGKLDEIFSGYTIQSGAEKAFNASEYRYKSSYDESGLYFIESNNILIIQSWTDIVDDINRQVSEMIKAAEVTDQADNGVTSEPSDSASIQNPWGSDEDSFDSVEPEITDLVNRRFDSVESIITDFFDRRSPPAENDIILQPFDPMNPQLVDGHFYTGDPDEPLVEFLSSEEGIAPYPAEDDIASEPSDSNPSFDHAKVAAVHLDIYNDPDPDEPQINVLSNEDELVSYPAITSDDDDIISQPSDSTSEQNPWGSDEDSVDLNSSSDHVDAEVTTAELDMDYPDPDEPNDLFDKHDNKDDYDKDIGDIKENGEVKEVDDDEVNGEGKDIGDIKENGEVRVSDENESMYGCEKDEPPSPAPSADAANAEASDASDAPA
ncbi:OmpA family protein [Neptunomonas antarctica]|uniref:OmpA family protein n=1 Tax=Neptunomonas antarctica TaxID=619304 RepID=A0A1N7KXP2_9GAMM|nr:OmpA family protein [Neptunomonas antarctica]SIS66190.1 OmpA family protein [Neptunomonas antarctica]